MHAGVTTAAERLGEIIGLLRDQAGEVPLRPVDEHIEELVAHAAGSGVPVGLHVAGEYADVAPMQYRAAYRVVQESLINATKHAAAASVQVLLGRRGDEMVVTVRNDPPRQAHAAGPAHGGRGITGLRERVAFAGGALRAAPRLDGGFEVMARLPVRPGPVIEAAPDPAPLTMPIGFDRAQRRARRWAGDRVDLAAGAGDRPGGNADGAVRPGQPDLAPRTVPRSPPAGT